MAHDHDHGHPDAPLRALGVAAGITGTVFLAELVGGLVSGSLALLSDALHMLSDAAGLIIALLAAAVGRRAASSRATFGHRRVEVLAALLNALTVTGVVVWILVQAVRRIGSGHEIDTTLMLGVAAVGLVANAASAFVLSRHSADNLNIRGAFLHVIADLLGSVAVIVAALVIRVTGWTHADTVASLVIVAVVLPRSLSLLRHTLEVLMEHAPRGVDTGEVERALADLPGVAAVHDVHVWSADGVTPLATAHLVVDEACVTPGGCGLLGQAQEALRRLRIRHSTIQLEHPGHAEHEAVCRP